MWILYFNLEPKLLPIFPPLQLLSFGFSPKQKLYHIFHAQYFIAPFIQEGFLKCITNCTNTGTPFTYH